MNILPLAFDSMGVRSMATFVETKEGNILIDPGAALGPSRYSLPPHPLEIAELEKRIRIIKKFAKKADILTISHYHYDHYMPEESFYVGKRLFIKHATNHINHSQFGRAKAFLEHLKNLNQSFEFSDGREVEMGKVQLSFSPPLWHGPEKSKLGWVIGLAIKEGKETLVHSSDVQGPLVKETTEWIIKQNPTTLILCGVLSYFLGWRYPTKYLKIANENVLSIMEKSNLKTLVVDHHLVRDLHFREKIAPVFERGEELGVKVMTAATYAGEEERFLEARRRELWKSGKTS